MLRITLAGIVGGLVCFAWITIAHIALPLGDVGFHTITNERTFLASLDSGMGKAGVYLFPSLDVSEAPTEEEYTAWTEKHQRGPVGFVAFNPAGKEPMAIGQFLRQFLINVAAAWIVAFMLSYTRVGYRQRVLFVTLAALFGWLVISVPYWNWYHFPADFTVTAGVIQVVGWHFAGLAMAAIVKPPLQR